MMQPLVIGAGEIGSAIIHCFARQGITCAVHDPPKGANAVVSEYGIVHVCVPAELVPETVMLCRYDALVIVHSTTLPGTLEQSDRPKLVHAPVEGRHPMISEYLLKWCMPVSGKPEAVTEAVGHMRKAAIPAQPWIGPQRVTELAKHLSTLRLGWDVAFMRMVYRLCEKEGVPFALVYTEWTRAYNAVYMSEGKGRPVLTPDKGVSVSHCVGPNSDTLQSWADEKGYRMLEAMCDSVADEMADSI